MNERNRRTLTEALARLRDYAAPTAAWDGIARRLADPPVPAKRLPTYAPPATVWNAINAELTAGQTQAPAPAPRPRSRPARRRLRTALAIAAGLAVLLSTGFGLLWRNVPGQPTVSYAFSQESAPASEPARDWDEDEASFTRVLAEVAARNQPKLNDLGTELDELNTARREVKAILVAYGEDPGVVHQLAEIERERSAVYRRIITEL